MHNIYCRHLLSYIPFQSQCRFKTTQTSTGYCLDLIRKYDYENFICTLLLKNTSRSVALAVRGFNVEVARVAEQVTQSNIGLMRLKFWEEVIDKCYSKNLKEVPQHPVAIELFKAITKANLSKRYLKNLVSARQSTINTQNIKTLEDMEKYADQTVSSIYYLILEGCGIRNMDADHAASHLGKAQGIVQQLRSIPHSKELNFIPIPQDVLIKYQISQEAILRRNYSQKFSDCVFEIASRAHQHLQMARSLGDKVPKDGKLALLPAVSVSVYLDRLQKVDYNVFDPSLIHRSWKLLPTVYWYMLKNTY